MKSGLHDFKDKHKITHKAMKNKDNTTNLVRAHPQKCETNPYSVSEKSKIQFTRQKTQQDHYSHTQSLSVTKSDEVLYGFGEQY